MGEINNNGNDQVALGKSNTAFITIGWISAFLSLIVYPFIFGVLGVIMGILATKNGSRAGLPVIVANIVLMGIGLIFSPVISSYLMNVFGI